MGGVSCKHLPRNIKQLGVFFRDLLETILFIERAADVNLPLETLVQTQLFLKARVHLYICFELLQPHVSLLHTQPVAFHKVGCHYGSTAAAPCLAVYQCSTLCFHSFLYEQEAVVHVTEEVRGYLVKHWDELPVEGSGGEDGFLRIHTKDVSDSGAGQSLTVVQVRGGADVKTALH